MDIHPHPIPSNPITSLTAGHVLDEAGADSVYVETSADGSRQRQLNPVKGCERFLGRPRFRLRWTHPRPCLDEICLLELPVGEDYRTLCKFPLDVDFRAIFPPVIAEYTSSKDPLDIDPIELQRWVVTNGPVLVHKLGSTTGLTHGKLVRIEEDFNWYNQPLASALSASSSISASSALSSSTSSAPSASFSPTSSASSVSSTSDFSFPGERDETRAFILHVEWLSPDLPFALPGDSGSLIFTIVNGKTVPLGIHIGSDGTLSLSYSLWSWALEVSIALDFSILFCESIGCLANAVCRDFVIDQQVH